MDNIITSTNLNATAILGILNTFSNRISALENAKTPAVVATAAVVNTTIKGAIPPIFINNGIISLSPVSWTAIKDKPSSLSDANVGNILNSTTVYLNPVWLGSISSSKVVGLATVATTGNYNDLSNKPTINGSVQPDWSQNTTTAIDYIKNKPTLSVVAITGNYVDLSNKPTIPSPQVNTDWNAVSGITAILNKPVFSTVATTGSYNDLLSKPSFAVVATTGSYDDLLSKPTIPAQFNPIQGNGISLTGTYPNITFVANQTLQQVLTSGGVLTGDNTITVGANTLKIGSDSDNYQIRLDKTNSSINLKSYINKVGKVSTATRSKIGVITAPNSDFTSIAPSLNIQLGRVGTTLSATTPSVLYQSYSNAGFEVQLNVQYFPQDGTHNFPTGSNLTDYLAKLTSFLTVAQGYNVKLVVVENEENNAGYRALDSNSASYYMAELTQSIPIIHSKGMKAANAGLTGHTFKYVIYNWLMTHSRQAEAAILFNAEFSPTQQSNILDGTYQTTNAPQITMANTVMNGIAAAGADYINFHWYCSALTDQPTVPVTNTLLIAKSAAEAWAGLPAITNEIGQHNNIATYPTDILKALVKAGMQYIIWYSGDGANPGDAVALQNLDFSLRPQGKNFAAFMAGYNSIDVPVIFDNNDIYIRNQYAGLLSLDSNHKLSTISPNTYLYANNYVVREQPVGAVNGTNTVFTLAFTPMVDKEMVFVNGVMQFVGLTFDYTIAGNVITFNTAPTSDKKIRVTYFKLI